MSRVVLRNRTAYDDAEVARLVRFAFSDLELPSRHSILVRVGYTRPSARRREAGGKYLYGASGRAHDYVFVRPDAPSGAAYEVHLRIGRPEEFPVSWPDRHKRQGVAVGELADWREALVAIAAHEGKHVERYQLIGGRSRLRYAGVSRRAEEARCDAFAARRLRNYRKEAS